MNLSARISCIVIPLVLLAAIAHAQPNEEDRRYRLAEGYERGGDMKNAARVYRELYDADKQSALYFEGVRRTYGALGLHGDLLPIVEERVASQPNDYELLIINADLLFKIGRRDDARALWKRALELGNFQELVYAIVAQSQTDNRAFDAAIETYRSGRERIGDRYMFADQLAYLYGAVGRYEDATREYLAMLGVAPDRLPIVKRFIAQMTSNPAALAATIRTVEQTVERNSDFEPTLDLLSWLYDEAGDFAGAFDVAKRLDHVRNTRGSNVFAYADRALREARYDAALGALDYFLATYGPDNPLHSIVLLTYARALEERQRETGTIDPKQTTMLIERYISLADREEGSEVAAEALFRAAGLQADVMDAPDEAIETLETLIAADRNAAVLADALVLLGDLRLRGNRLDEAALLYDRAIAESRQDEESGDNARLRRAELALYRGEFKKAVDSLTELTRNTGGVTTNDALAHLFILQENFERNDAALGSYYKGRLALVQQSWDEAIASFDATIDAARGTMIAEEAALAKAVAMSSSGDHSEAMELLLAFVAATPEALAADRALYRAAVIADTELRDPMRALELYTRLLGEYPRSQHTAAARVRIRLLRNG